MAWDSSRPVPWRRLVREWLIYVVIMGVILVVVVSPEGRPGAIGGLLVSGPAYLGLGAVLAKFGYQRDRLKRAAARSAAGSDDETVAPRRRPAPTRRTGGGTPPRRR
ncbi:hypothetical protein N9E02_01875 [Ilumatobacteraceae bacterium]|nr:hypothetical protein [Ilumatobacteraceae bacterium]